VRDYHPRRQKQALFEGVAPANEICEPANEICVAANDFCGDADFSRVNAGAGCGGAGHG
jgi:hypothetical protein